MIRVIKSKNDPITLRNPFFMVDSKVSGKISLSRMRSESQDSVRATSLKEEEYTNEEKRASLFMRLCEFQRQIWSSRGSHLSESEEGL